MTKTFRLLSILTIFCFFSCGKDDNAPAIEIKNEIQYGEETLIPTDGLILDYGAQAESHYNYDFYVSDGEITLVDGLLNIDESTNFYIYTDMKSLGTEGFSNGLYSFNQVRQFVDKNIFVSPFIFIRNGETFQAFPVTGGFVTISGVNPEFIITYDLIVIDRLLSGSFKGTFDIESAI